MSDGARHGKTTRPRGGLCEGGGLRLPGGTLRRMVARRRVVVLGAAAHNFHDFNVVFRGDRGVASSRSPPRRFQGSRAGATRRRSPARLADGIPIRRSANWRRCAAARPSARWSSPSATSSHAHVMHLASRALALGADLSLLGPGAPRCSCAPSAWSRSRRCARAAARAKARCDLAKAAGRAGLAGWPPPPPDALRRPPAAAGAQFSHARGDLDAAHCTLEEREEYEPLSPRGAESYSQASTTAAVPTPRSGKADVVLWGGGDNDFPFMSHGARGDAPTRSGRRSSTRTTRARPCAHGRHRRDGKVDAAPQVDWRACRSRSRSYTPPRRSCARPRP